MKKDDKPTVSRGDIYWINKSSYREAVGAVQQAERPAIIVSNQKNNEHSSTLEVIYLTTSPKRDLPTHVTIRSTDRVSTALCEQITTISDEQIGNYLGRITEAEMATVEAAMLISLGIAVCDMEEPEDASNICDMIVAAEVQKEAEIYKKLYYELLDKITSK